VVGVSALARDSDASGRCPVREGDRYAEHATDAVLTVVEIVTVDGTAMARIESEHPTLGTARHRRPRADVRERVRRGCWVRIRR